MTPVVDVVDVAKAYRTPHGTLQALAGVSAEIPPGGALALVGESGCGKSTLAMAVAGLVVPDAGRIRIEGQDMADLPPARRAALRRRIGVVFQDPYSSLNPRRTAGEAIGEALDLAGRLPRAERRAAIAERLVEVGLAPDHADRHPHMFSGGQRQRIAIARALALQPRLLILDEPTSALDVSVQAQILNLLRELRERRGIACLFVSHNLATVEHVAERVMVMYLGRCLEYGPTRAVFARPRHPYTRALLDAVPDLARPGGLKGLAGDVPSPLARPAGCVFAARCARAAAPCIASTPSLSPVGAPRGAACFLPLEE